LINKIQSNQISGPKSLETQVPKEYLEIAEGMEAQFVDFLMGEMEKSIPRETPLSNAEGYYNATLNYERAQQAAKGQGLGIKRMILDQIYPEHLRKQIKPNNVTMNTASQDVKRDEEKSHE
jgi:Rod binding domain-containing protein